MKTIVEIKRELNPACPKNERAGLRLSEQEKKEFKRDARKEGLSLSDWFRLTGKIKLELNKEKK